MMCRLLFALLFTAAQDSVKLPEWEAKNFAYVQAIQKVAPSVVSIEGLTTPGVPIFRGFVQRLQLQTGATGFLVSKQGHIVTTYDITKNLKDIQVTLTDGRRFPAKKFYEDRWLNFSVLQIEGTGPFTPATFGDSSALRPGESVLAVGFPLAEGLTATVGVLSSFRDFYLLTDYMVPYAIQTDATYYPFNIGGPLVNMKGEVVGMNIFSAESIVFIGFGFIPPDVLRNVQNINFAFPSNLLKEYLPIALAGESIFHPWIGLHVTDVSEFMRYYVGFPPDWIDREVGVVVDWYDYKGPAPKKGVRHGDIILGAKIYYPETETKEKTVKEEIVFKSPTEFAATIAKMKKGEQIRLSIIREGKIIDVGFYPFDKPDDAFPGTV